MCLPNTKTEVLKILELKATWKIIHLGRLSKESRYIHRMSGSLKETIARLTGMVVAGVCWHGTLWTSYSSCTLP